MTKTDKFEILPPELTVKAMRDSGYKDTAHALAELVDNSLQAGLTIKQKETDVEIICCTELEHVKKRTMVRIKHIAVFDNASGMNEETLRIALQFGNGTHLKDQDGIGKFGMGLPNASVSQCRDINVYTWQKSVFYHTYLNLDEIASGKMREVPKPTKTSGIPKEWLKKIKKYSKDHGTLVVWSDLDRLRWKTPKALFDNCEFLLGRIYRYFLKDKQLSIRFASYDHKKNLEFEKFVSPNDPLYLMNNTCVPSEYKKKPAFVKACDDEKVEIKVDGSTEIITLKFSLVTEKPRKQGGSSLIGKHASKNVGISIVRANRELSMDWSFVNYHDPRERWWGCEISFTPKLDDIFGVTITKQEARNFRWMDLSEDAEKEYMTEKEFQEYLEETNDPRAIIYELTKRIDKKLSSLRQQISNMAETKKSKNGASEDIAENIGKQAIAKRKEKLGHEGTSDKQEEEDQKQREKDLAETLEELGETPKNAAKEALKIIKENKKVSFRKAELPGTNFFDVQIEGGVIFIVLNTKHPAYKHLFQILESSEKSDALKSIKLMFIAWARLEDEAGLKSKQEFEDVRQDWGRTARDFLKISEEY